MMALHIDCPSCGRRLTVSESFRGERMICPRCLAEVAVPGAAGPEGMQAGRPERREGGLSCPRCGLAVEAIWLNCPWCHEPLHGRRSGGYGRPDLDVRRDRQATGVGVILLAVLGGFGVAIMGLGASEMLVQGAAWPMAYLCVGLLFLAGLTTLVVYARSGGKPGAAGFRRVAVGTLAMAGVATLILGCGLMALFILLCIACGPPRGLMNPAPTGNYRHGL